MTTVLLCDDHRVVREALAPVLAAATGVDRVEQAGSGEEVLVRYDALRPAAVVLDVRLPGIDGLATLQRLLEVDADVRVLVLTGEVREEERLRALRLGARGYLAKDVDTDALQVALATVVAGEDTLTRAQRRAVASEPVVTAPLLTPRELQVLEGMAEGRSNAEIGQVLWLSEDTIKVHAKKLFAKTGVHDRAAAVAWAFRSGVLA